MFNVFRLRYLSPLFQKFELTGRLFSTIVGFWNGVTSGRWMHRGVVAGLLAIALWLGAAVPAPTVQAAATPEAEEYDPGPIRQTRNPVSGENFNGGVDARVLNQRESRRQPEDDNKSLLGTIKDKITGEESKEMPADMKTEKNPTLERYPKSLE